MADKQQHAKQPDSQNFIHKEILFQLKRWRLGSIFHALLSAACDLPTADIQSRNRHFC